MNLCMQVGTKTCLLPFGLMVSHLALLVLFSMHVTRHLTRLTVCHLGWILTYLKVILPSQPPCSRLWCATAEGEHKGCRTQHMPWADGTGCGEGYWCLKSECVPKNPDAKKVINGQWGAWQPWTDCSRTCGGGIQKSIRHCTNPSPKNGGHYCVGHRVRYESCNTEDCSLDAKDFRLEQCEQFNGNDLGIEGVPKDVKWVPKYTSSKSMSGLIQKKRGLRVFLSSILKVSGPDQCKLFCRIEHSSAYYLLSSSVIDGTPCGTDTFHTCVDGQCIPAGCDRVLHSNKTQGTYRFLLGMWQINECTKHERAPAQRSPRAR